MIPGRNLLNLALSVIAKQSLVYYKFASRSQNVIGQDVTVYAPGATIVGSWQPVSRKLYEQYGLDFQKDYFVLYTSNNTLDITRDVSADQVAFNGQRYQCESNTEWFQLDGWNGILCCHIGNDTGDTFVWGFGKFNKNFGNGNFLGTET
jgi:hypothetical protein